MFLSHFASLFAEAKAMNLNSIVEWEIHDYFLDAHDIAPPPRVNIQPDVDLLSPTLVTQLASEYPSNIAGYPE